MSQDADDQKPVVRYPLVARLSATETRDLHRCSTRYASLNARQLGGKALSFTEDVDIDDTEFGALTEHIKGKFWSADKASRKGLDKKSWSKFISAEELFAIVKSQK